MPVPGRPAGCGCPATPWPGVGPTPSPTGWLRHVLGAHGDAARIDAFLDHGPETVACFETHTARQFVDGNAIPDRHGQVPGAATQGHQLIAAPIDGRRLGPLTKRLRKTMRETAFIGMPIRAGADLAALHDGPNPRVAAIEQAPFYAVKLLAGSFGSFAGLKSNAAAQVRDADDAAIAGLYAVTRCAPTWPA